MQYKEGLLILIIIVCLLLGIMAEEGVGKSKKSSRLNSKKEDKVELFIDKTWKATTVLFSLRRLTLQLTMRKDSISLQECWKELQFTKTPKMKSYLPCL